MTNAEARILAAILNTQNAVISLLEILTAESPEAQRIAADAKRIILEIADDSYGKLND